jgi:hypothetical protein
MLIQNIKPSMHNDLVIKNKYFTSFFLQISI